MQKAFPTRRSFLKNTSLALVGTTLLTTSSTFASIFENIPFEGYKALSEEKNDLRTHFSEKTLKVYGTLYQEKSGILPCANALVEVWHLSPNSKYFEHRGKFRTDEEGNYIFWTDFPNRKEGYKSRIFFKATSDTGETFTELIMDNQQAYISHTHWEKNHALKSKLFPSYKLQKKEGEIEFNFLIN